MLGSIVPVAALLASVALLLMGNGLQGTLLPVRAFTEGFSSVEIGLLGSLYFVGFALGCLVGSKLLARAGHIRVFAAMSTIASSIALTHVLFIDPVIWWLLRGASGFCFAVLFIVTESWLNEKATNENRGVVFGTYLVVNLTFIAVGQMLIVLGEPSGFTLFAVACILISLAATPVTMTKSAAPEPTMDAAIRLRRLYSQSPVGVVGCFVVGLTNGAFWSLAPVYAKEGSGSTAMVAVFMTIAVAAGAVAQWPLGRLSDRSDRRWIILAAALLAGFSGAAITTLPGSWGSMTLSLVALYGFFAFPLYSLCVAHMNDFVERNAYVETAGGLLLVFAAGAMVGPLGSSWLFSEIGPDGLFLFTAACHVSFAGFTLYRMTQRQKVPEDEQGAFIDAIRVAQTVSMVDPLSPATTTNSNGPSVEDVAKGGEGQSDRKDHDHWGRAA